MIQLFLVLSFIFRILLKKILRIIVSYWFVISCKYCNMIYSLYKRFSTFLHESESLYLNNVIPSSQVNFMFKSYMSRTKLADTSSINKHHDHRNQEKDEMKCLCSFSSDDRIYLSCTDQYSSSSKPRHHSCSYLNAILCVSFYIYLIIWFNCPQLIFLQFEMTCDVLKSFILSFCIMCTTIWP